MLRIKFFFREHDFPKDWRGEASWPARRAILPTLQPYSEVRVNIRNFEDFMLSMMANRYPEDAQKWYKTYGYHFTKGFSAMNQLYYFLEYFLPQDYYEWCKATLVPVMIERNKRLLQHLLAHFKAMASRFGSLRDLGYENIIEGYKELCQPDDSYWERLRQLEARYYSDGRNDFANWHQEFQPLLVEVIRFYREYDFDFVKLPEESAIHCGEDTIWEETNKELETLLAAPALKPLLVECQNFLRELILCNAYTTLPPALGGDPFYDLTRKVYKELSLGYHPDSLVRRLPIEAAVADKVFVALKNAHDWLKQRCKDYRGAGYSEYLPLGKDLTKIRKDYGIGVQQQRRDVEKIYKDMLQSYLQMKLSKFTARLERLKDVIDNVRSKSPDLTVVAKVNTLLHDITHQHDVVENNREQLTLALITATTIQRKMPLLEGITAMAEQLRWVKMGPVVARTSHSVG